MRCEICNQSEATIHLTEIAEGVRTEMHMCEQCAEGQGVAMKSSVSINEFLSGLLASTPDEQPGGDFAEKSLQCPSCGFTLDKFRKEAVLGCPHDYEIFKNVLTPLIERAHNGATSHCGKIPSKLPKDQKEQLELANLKQRLNSAVRAEDYELAAQLRDQIQEYEKK